MSKALQFYKYQGTGNDFVIIDNRTNNFKNNTKLVKKLCDPKFGIGADGLICLENSMNHDFKMVYFNADGHESSMCGNGGRCIVAFAKHLGIIEKHCTFEAVDGLHKAQIESNGQVQLKMSDVDEINNYDNNIVLDTGSPHFVSFIENVENIDVHKKGADIRYSDPFTKDGINVNFAHVEKDTLKIRTYERGVEDETLSCGTGVTAVAIAAADQKLISTNLINIKTPGGSLSVKFDKSTSGYENVWLIGPAKMVFKGEILC
ncbi:diaminopimelate epimerase [Mesohalobacter halotolerans]|uniref:Diaminopimelate epimerase n=1 Tax=Mesohalobacter halotolerans TaxID=1883405 RepID=A0A4U5TNS3_9FLAO|nr:diaminopimelate epimerase [Mesohalobacter halotolerans]MBS3737517.1 diaminopimelate epimerase [Psychroflexus sp.]TKS55699.1 diaminopimelate epimerase [Mesohalobacter halotolerans]